MGKTKKYDNDKLELDIKEDMLKLGFNYVNVISAYQMKDIQIKFGSKHLEIYFENGKYMDTIKKVLDILQKHSNVLEVKAHDITN